MKLKSIHLLPNGLMEGHSPDGVVHMLGYWPRILRDKVKDAGFDMTGKTMLILHNNDWAFLSNNGFEIWDGKEP